MVSGWCLQVGGVPEPGTNSCMSPAPASHYCVVVHTEIMYDVAATRTRPGFTMEAACQGSISNLVVGFISIELPQDCPEEEMEQLKNTEQFNLGRKTKGYLRY